MEPVVFFGQDVRAIFLRFPLIDHRTVADGLHGFLLGRTACLLLSFDEPLRRVGADQGRLIADRADRALTLPPHAVHHLSELGLLRARYRHRGDRD